MLNDLLDRSPLLLALTDYLAGQDAALSAWELDGMACGLSCTPAGPDDPGLQRLLELLQVGTPDAEEQKQFRQLLALCRIHLEDSDCTFSPVLPDEADELAERTGALGLWCQGFLAGYGAVAKEVSAETTETLQDLSAISQVDSELEDSDEGEWDLERVSEYLRIAVMDLYLGSQAPSDIPAAPDGGTLH